MTIKEVHTQKERKASPVKIWTTDIDDSALEQLLDCATLPFIHKHIAVMPDVHKGIGSTIGSVIPTHGAIIPAAVGVDIGCGMMACKLNITASHLPDNLYNIRSAIEAAVPHGRTDHGGPNDRGAWDNIPTNISNVWYRQGLHLRLSQIRERTPDLYNKQVNDLCHLGTLGTGNHFIELCLDENQDVWIMLHSGSRGVGNRIGTYFIELAKKEMERWFVHLPDKDLAYFPEGSEYFDDYVAAVGWAQDYAKANRELMMEAVLNAINQNIWFKYIGPVKPTETAINCHHNYVEKENHYGANVWVTRKGAIRARPTDLGIIPGSMGAKSFIVKGKGNPDSFSSCSHGAGRTMGRKEAARRYTVDDLARQTDGVECRKDVSVLDEIPSAYKDIDRVMANQDDLVEIIHTLKQVVCVKG